MPANMQGRILDRLQQITETHGLEFAQRATYGNTGLVFAQDRDFKSAVVASYDFQGSYCKFHFGPDKTARSKDRGCGFQYYENQADMLAIFKRWTQHLQAAGYTTADPEDAACQLQGLVDSAFAKDEEVDTGSLINALDLALSILDSLGGVHVRRRPLR
jgi:hypothetical protein